MVLIITSIALIAYIFIGILLYEFMETESEYDVTTMDRVGFIVVSAMWPLIATFSAIVTMIKIIMDCTKNN